MPVVCSTCGEQNSPDAQFCAVCGAYLAWHEGSGPSGPGPDADPPGWDDPTATVIRPVHRASASGDGGLDERPSFEADLEVAEVTVPLDGSVVRVTANLVNTSHVVESYLVEPVDAPHWLEVLPGKTELLPAATGTVEAQLCVTSSSLVPAQQVSVMLRVRSTAQQAGHRDLPVRVTVPVVTAPLAIRAEPRVLRVPDLSPVTCTVVVSNARSNRWAQVRLSASDPEQVVRVTCEPRKLQVPPGGEAAASVRLEAPGPEPGGQISRAVTIVAVEGDRSAEATVTLEQSASVAPIDLLTLRLEPSVLRLDARRRGRLAAYVDNRAGGVPVRVHLRGQDSEKKLNIAISPTVLDVPAGFERAATVSVTAPRTPPGKEVTRSLTIVGSDGRSDTSVDGSVIQLATSRRGVARVCFTVTGALAMVVGALLPIVAGAHHSSMGLTAAEVATEVDTKYAVSTRDRLGAGGGLENVVSMGLFLTVLAGFVLLGLTGSTGRMTRRAALLGMALVVGTFVGSAILTGGSGPGSGTVLALLGCVLAYVGGLLARR